MGREIKTWRWSKTTRSELAIKLTHDKVMGQDLWRLMHYAIKVFGERKTRWEEVRKLLKNS